MDFKISILLALLGGILPSLIWLFFWLKQDQKHPEPNKLLLATFGYGIVVVFFAFLIEEVVSSFLLRGQEVKDLFFTQPELAITVIVLWVFTEEALKYWAAYQGGLSKKANNEPIDPIIYMITAALGFSAIENVLFLFTPISQGDIMAAFMVGNMRFVGATLLHVSSSAIIGLYVAFSYYKNAKIKKKFLINGIILAVILHTAFNSFIIMAENFTLLSFMFVWLTIIAIILLFEKIKKIKIPKKL